MGTEGRGEWREVSGLYLDIFCGEGDDGEWSGCCSLFALIVLGGSVLRL